MDQASRLPVSKMFYLLFILFGTLQKAQAGEDVLYPYDTHTSFTFGPLLPVILHQDILYYGQRFNEVYISPDGLLSFEPGVGFREVDWRNGLPYQASDYPFIAPFHHNGFKPNDPDKYSGKIFYELYDRGNLGSDYSQAFLSYLDNYLANASVVLKTFRTNLALVVTWQNVTSVGECPTQITANCNKTNTFQLVLAADSNHTFLIFNYYKMDIGFTNHQLAGINGGYGRGWTDVIPCSGSCAKLKLEDKLRFHAFPTISGSDVVGRFILVASDETIVRGGCLSTTLKQAHLALEVYPRHVGLFGGEMLSVSASCIPPGTPIRCRFAFSDSQVSYGVMETEMRGRCPVPLLITRGQIAVEIATEINWLPYRAQITVVLPSRLQQSANLKPPLSLQGSWQELSARNLMFQWNPSGFTTVNPNALVNISLIGYREISSTEVEWKRLISFGTDISNQRGMHEVSPVPCSGKDCTAFEIGLVQVQLQDKFVDDTTLYQFYTSGPLPLGWYVNSSMTSLLGPNWPAAMCKNWSMRQTSTWLQNLPPCPCTLTQALADWGRWQPDLGCNQYSTSTGNCVFHKGAKHCVRSVHPSSDGAGNQCCYKDDGSLLYAADSDQGSTPDRWHDWGDVFHLFRRPFPSLSHWIEDVIPFYYCCLWTNYEQCSLYMDQRPTRDCKDYIPTHSAIAFGDPSIQTFDGVHYNFGGSGDFWLIQSDPINIQARFQELTYGGLLIPPNNLKPTVLTSLVAWNSDSDNVTISLAPEDAWSRHGLHIKINSLPQFFDDPAVSVQDFYGVTVINNEATAVDPLDRNHGNFTILFKGRVSLQVSKRYRLLHVIVSLPPDQTGKTRGLLGTWDGHQENEFMKPDGSTVPITANESSVYKEFALKWNVSENETRFQFPKALVGDKLPIFGYFKNFTYKMGSLPPSDSDLRRVCFNNAICQRDYWISNSSSVATATLLAQQTFQQIQAAQTVVPTCGLLNIPMANKNNTNYTEGSVIQVINCKPYNTAFLNQGPVTYKCLRQGIALSWSPAPYSNLCQAGSTTSSSNSGMIAGIVIGVIVLIIIIAIIAIIVIRRHRAKDSNIEGRPVPAKRTVNATDAKAEPGEDVTLLKHKREPGNETVRMSEVEKNSSIPV